MPGDGFIITLIYCYFYETYDILYVKQNITSLSLLTGRTVADLNTEWLSTDSVLWP